MCIRDRPEGIADTAHSKAVEAVVRSVYDAHALDGMIGRAQEKITENTLTCLLYTSDKEVIEV